MKINIQINRARGGYALLLVLGFMAIGLSVLAAIAMWTSTNSNLVERNNQYYRSLAAAEAATEHVVAQIAWDFQNSGEGVVSNNMAKYRGKNPKASGHANWEKYKFNNGKSEDGATHVENTVGATFTNLQSQYKGLYGMASTYRIISNAEETDAIDGIVGAVGQEIQVVTIPIFQFAIFSSMDLEINPGKNMTVNGRVHANHNIYAQPVNNLTFQSDVTAAGEIIHNKKPGDPSTRTASNDIDYLGEHDSGVNALTLPIGTNNTPAEVRKILDIPPFNEKHDSLMGQQRYYNKADLIIVVSDSGVTAHGSVANGNGPVLQYNKISSFVKTNVTFYNGREGKTVKAVEIDVAALKTFAESSGPLQASIKDDRLLNCIYVADQRTQTGSTQSGIKVVNGATLPKDGLTISTPNPLYVEGHFNAPSDALGTADTSKTKPSSLVADAITVLSENWSDANSGKSLGNRIATPTTVNAAFLAGVVPTSGGFYSGGVENFPRFLENWNNVKFTYNGSMVLMFESATAKAPWGPPSGYYDPPLRTWAFDLNFLDPKKLPPGTPAVRTILRAAWGILPPNTTTAPIKQHGSTNANGGGNGKNKGQGN